MKSNDKLTERARHLDNANKSVYEIPEASSLQRWIGKKLKCNFYYYRIDSATHQILGKKFIDYKMTKIGEELIRFNDGEYDIDPQGIFEGKKEFEVDMDITNAVSAIRSFDASSPIPNLPNGKISPKRADNYTLQLADKVFLSGMGKFWRKIAIYALIACVITSVGMMFGITQWASANAKATNQLAHICQSEPNYTGCPPPKKVEPAK